MDTKELLDQEQRKNGEAYFEQIDNDQIVQVEKVEPDVVGKMAYGGTFTKLSEGISAPGKGVFLKNKMSTKSSETTPVLMRR